MQLQQTSESPIPRATSTQNSIPSQITEALHHYKHSQHDSQQHITLRARQSVMGKSQKSRKYRRNCNIYLKVKKTMDIRALLAGTTRVSETEKKRGAQHHTESLRSHIKPARQSLQKRGRKTRSRSRSTKALPPSHPQSQLRIPSVNHQRQTHHQKQIHQHQHPAAPATAPPHPRQPGTASAPTP